MCVCVCVCALALFLLLVVRRSDAGSAASSSYPQLHLNVVSDSQLATVDQQGTVRLLETQHASLER